MFLIFQQGEVDLVVLCKAGGHRSLSKGRALSMKGVNKELVFQVYFWSTCCLEALV